jgi:hypothetical protein
MKSLSKKLVLSTIIATILVVSASANASNGTKKPPSFSLFDFSTYVLLAERAEQFFLN